MSIFKHYEQKNLLQLSFLRAGVGAGRAGAGQPSIPSASPAVKAGLLAAVPRRVGRRAEGERQHLALWLAGQGGLAE